MPEEERFNVVFFDDQGYWETFLRDATAEKAVVAAKRCVDNLGSRGIADKVIITDADDFTVFLWQRGKGVVFPPKGEDVV